MLFRSVRAEVRKLGHYSAHADQQELIDWIMERGPARGGLFLNHGEEKARRALREFLIDRGLESDKILLPDFDESFTLVAGSPAQSVARCEPRIDPAELQRDWHNEYADFILQLSQRLQATNTSKQRHELIARLSKTLRE